MSGARIAQKGEFTKRALLNGKIDLLQAEAVLDTVYASCNEARKLAIAQYEGKLSEKIYQMKSKIVDLLALAEANIDFPEEDDVNYDRIKFTEDIGNIITNIDELLKGANAAAKIKEGYKTLIMGRANVGKSTLFNKLLGYDRAIVHEKPGTTRDYIEEGIEIGSYYLRLIDTAGVFDKAIGPDKIALERTKSLLVQTDLILLMFDGSEAMNEEDVYLYDFTKSKKKILIVNKIDLNLKLSTSEILCDSVKISAKTGENIDLLREKIRNVLTPEIKRENLLLTKQRHVDALKRVRHYLQNIQNVQNLEIVAFELHSALDVIGELTGQVMRKEILDRIFDEFCIGK
jgi:tRNA modification GTPase